MKPYIYSNQRALNLPTKSSSKPRLTWLVLLSGAFLVWFWPTKTTLEYQYDEIMKAAKTQPSVAAQAEIGNLKINIPDWSFFKDGAIWSLVNKQAQLSNRFTPDLVDSPIEHTGNSMKVAVQMSGKLEALHQAATREGVRLMLSSAYRSANDQQAIYDSYLRSHGQAYVNDYVARPGTSEHQTGLAVDISSYSSACKAQASQCSLDFSAISWLRNNASKFGFIQRYPSGKQSITGVAGEAWHYRYVGTELAKLLTSSNLTLDEFVAQIAPGYAK